MKVRQYEIESNVSCKRWVDKFLQIEDKFPNELLSIAELNKRNLMVSWL